MVTIVLHSGYTIRTHINGSVNEFLHGLQLKMGEKNAVFSLHNDGQLKALIRTSEISAVIVEDMIQ